MHRLNANRSSLDNTSNSLSDSSIRNIQDGMERISQRRTAKRQNFQRTASRDSVETSTMEKKAQILKFASIADIPSDFERIGTGFFRRSHHLWELAPNEGGGVILVRKHGEDHVLGYDPEPIARTASIAKPAVTDRFGNTIKIGSKVRLPHRGKIATATVILLSPQSLGLETGMGEKINAAPDMVEILEQMMLETLPEASSHSHVEVSKPSSDKIESEEDEEEENKEGDDDEENGEDKKSSGMVPKVEPSSKNASLSEEDKENWNNYWRSVGQRVAQTMTVPKQSPPTTGMPKSPAPKSPKPSGRMLTNEQKERRRQRRKERRQEMKGLPEGAVLPPKKPIKTADSVDDRARDKEYVRICDQLVDALSYILEDDKYKDQPEMLADAIGQELEEYKDQIEGQKQNDEDDMENDLSIEAPTKDKKNLDDLRSAGKISVSMSSLK